VIVVDTDIVAYAFIRSDPVRTRLADTVSAIDPAWAVPPVWVSEFRNVLATLMRFRGLTPGQARRLAVGAEAHLGRRLVRVYTPEVLDLVAASGLSAYDCEFVAAARSLGVRLVTGDRAIARAFPGTAVTMEDFAAG
jgi:predicted nucleic acid-binding protein